MKSFDNEVVQTKLFKGCEQMKQYIDEAEKVLMHTYNRYKIVAITARYVFMILRKKYLDFVAGITVFHWGIIMNSITKH